MSDPTKDLIKEIHEKLEELHDRKLKLGIGRLEENQHAAPPFVFWRFGTIGNAPSDVIGSDKAAIYTDVERFAVAIWCETQDECRVVRRNLLRAMRVVCGGAANITIADFGWMTEEVPAWMHAGHKLIGGVTLRIPLTKAPEAFPVQLATITDQDHTVFLNDEEVC